MKMDKNNFKACYPFEYEMDLDKFDYSTNNSLDKYLNNEHSNIQYLFNLINMEKHLSTNLCLTILH